MRPLGHLRPLTRCAVAYAVAASKSAPAASVAGVLLGNCQLSTGRTNDTASVTAFVSALERTRQAFGNGIRVGSADKYARATVRDIL